MEKVFHHVIAWKNGKTAEIKYYILGGNRYPYFSFCYNGCADHEGALRHFPGLKLFADLHLCGPDGEATHGAENAFYHYAEGIHPDGSPCYYPTKEAEQLDHLNREQAAFSRFIAESGLAPDIARDIWTTVKTYGDGYCSKIFNLARRHRLTIPREKLTLVNARNNGHLASTLRISMQEAEAIPPGVTKEQFIAQYVDPHRPRWQEEADTALAWLAEQEANPMPTKEDEKSGKALYMSAATYKAWRAKLAEEKEQDRQAKLKARG